MRAGLKVVYSPARLASRVSSLGRSISRDYSGRTLDVVFILENAFIFGADLVRRISRPVVCHFVRSEMRDVKLDGHERREVFFSHQPHLKDRDVLLVDAVLEVMRIPRSAIRPAPSLPGSEGPRLFLGACGTALAYFLWYRAMQRHAAGSVGAYMFLQPLVATSLSRVLLGESLTAPTIAGGLVILGGVYLVVWPSRAAAKRRGSLEGAT